MSAIVIRGYVMSFNNFKIKAILASLGILLGVGIFFNATTQSYIINPAHVYVSDNGEVYLNAKSAFGYGLIPANETQLEAANNLMFKGCDPFAGEFVNTEIYGSFCQEYYNEMANPNFLLGEYANAAYNATTANNLINTIIASAQNANQDPCLLLQPFSRPMFTVLEDQRDEYGVSIDDLEGVQVMKDYYYNQCGTFLANNPDFIVNF